MRTSPSRWEEKRSQSGHVSSLAKRNPASVTAQPATSASPEGAALAGPSQTYTAMAEMGAATGIEFLGNGRLVAVAEPVRRGGGSAAVVRPA